MYLVTRIHAVCKFFYKVFVEGSGLGILDLVIRWLLVPQSILLSFASLGGGCLTVLWRWSQAAALWRLLNMIRARTMHAALELSDKGCQSVWALAYQDNLLGGHAGVVSLKGLLLTLPSVATESFKSCLSAVRAVSCGLPVRVRIVHMLVVCGWQGSEVNFPEVGPSCSLSGSCSLEGEGCCRWSACFHRKGGEREFKC